MPGARTILEAKMASENQVLSGLPLVVFSPRRSKQEYPTDPSPCPELLAARSPF